jgi:hypothetical protein
MISNLGTRVARGMDPERSSDLCCVLWAVLGKASGKSNNVKLVRTLPWYGMYCYRSPFNVFMEFDGTAAIDILPTELRIAVDSLMSVIKLRGTVVAETAESYSNSPLFEPGRRLANKIIDQSRKESSNALAPELMRLGILKSVKGLGYSMTVEDFIANGLRSTKELASMCSFIENDRILMGFNSVIERAVSVESRIPYRRLAPVGDYGLKYPTLRNLSNAFGLKRSEYASDGTLKRFATALSRMGSAAKAENVIKALFNQSIMRHQDGDLKLLMYVGFTPDEAETWRERLAEMKLEVLADVAHVGIGGSLFTFLAKPRVTGVTSDAGGSIMTRTVLLTFCNHELNGMSVPVTDAIKTRTQYVFGKKR